MLVVCRTASRFSFSPHRPWSSAAEVAWASAAIGRDRERDRRDRGRGRVEVASAHHHHHTHSRDAMSNSQIISYLEKEIIENGGLVRFGAEQRRP